MKVKELLTNTILRMDLLSATPSLRSRKQPQYQTIFGGILSFIIMCLFSYFLYLQMNNMLSHLNISYTQGLSDDISSSTPITQFPFAISIQNVNLGETPRKFIFQLWQNSIVVGSNGLPVVTTTPITLSPCNVSAWASYGSSFSSQAGAFGFGQMLCIASGQNISLVGYAGSTTYQYLNLQIMACDQSKDSSCDSASNINTYVNNYVSNHDYFKVRFFVLDTILTPTNEDPITRVLQKNIFVAFSKTIGTFGYINMATYQIDTDTSLLPNEATSTLTGNFIQTYKSNSVSLSGTKYVDYFVYKSTKSLTISRTLGKIDTVLSYVGGLFSLLFTGVAFFIGSYSQYKYELYIAESMLTVDQKGKKIREKDLCFFTYLFYSVYDWLDTFGIAPKSLTKLKDIHEIREQACEQLDPVLILKRIKYLEDVSKVLLSQHRQMCLYLSQPLTLVQAKRMRSTLHYYDSLMNQLRQNKGEMIVESYSEEKGFPFMKSNAIENQSQLQSIKSQEKGPDKQPEKELTKEQQVQMLNNMMHEALQKIQLDNSEVGQKIKTRIDPKAKDCVKENKRRAIFNDTNFNAQTTDLMSPLENLRKAEETYLQPKQVKQKDVVKMKVKKVKI